MSAQLSDSHRDLITSSGVTDEVCQARGYRTATTAAELENYGFAHTQRIVPALVMPIRSIDGVVVSHQIRPDQPRNCRGKVAKYEVPQGFRLLIDVPPSCRDRLLNGDDVIYIVEGVRQADAAASHGLCCINTLGAGIHPGSNTKEAKNLLSHAEWSRIPLDNRQVILSFSSAVTSDSLRFKALRRLGDFLQERGAIVRVMVFEVEADGSSVGLDDYLATGQSKEDLLALAKYLAEFGHDPQSDCPYLEKDGGIWWLRPSKDGFEEVQLTNFTARIVAELVVTDGVEKHREFEIEALVDGQSTVLSIMADRFDAMDWVLPQLGARAIINSGYGYSDRVRHAIQLLSTEIETRQVIQHLGWVEHSGSVVFAHAGGVICGAMVTEEGGEVSAETSVATGEEIGGAVDNEAAPDELTGAHGGTSEDPNVVHRPSVNSLPAKDMGCAGPTGPVSSGIHTDCIEVRLPEGLENFCLPTPPSGARLRSVIRDSMRLLKLEPPEVMFPLFAAIYRAPIGVAPYSLWLDAPTGNHKSVRAALAQQHFGAKMDYENLPASWDSTANANAALAFSAKDVLLVVDDFVIRGVSGDNSTANRDADRLLRSQANHSARRRCSGDGSLRPAKSPRGLIICTGEASPEGHSLNARLLRLDCSDSSLTDDELQRSYLKLCQNLGKDGVFAESMAGFIQWLSPQLDRVVEDTRQQINEFRQIFREHCEHPRTATIMADLLAGFENFLDFARDAGVIDEAEFAELWEAFHEPLFGVAKNQRRHLAEHDPGTQFLELLADAFLSGRAHLTNREGGPPEDLPTRWGWWKRGEIEATPKPKLFNSRTNSQREIVDGGDGHDRREQATDGNVHCGDDTESEKSEVERLGPRGAHIGYWDHLGVYLIPKAALAVAQQLARNGGWTLPIRDGTLGHALKSKNALLSTDQNRKKLTTRINVEGARPNVYHVDPNKILREPFLNHPALEDDWEGPDLADELIA